MIRLSAGTMAQLSTPKTRRIRFTASRVCGTLLSLPPSLAPSLSSCLSLLLCPDVIWKQVCGTLLTRVNKCFTVRREVFPHR